MYYNTSDLAKKFFAGKHNEIGKGNPNDLLDAPEMEIEDKSA